MVGFTKIQKDNTLKPGHSFSWKEGLIGRRVFYYRIYTEDKFHAI